MTLCAQGAAGSLVNHQSFENIYYIYIYIHIYVYCILGAA